MFFTDLNVQKSQKYTHILMTNVCDQKKQATKPFFPSKTKKGKKKEKKKKTN